LSKTDAKRDATAQPQAQPQVQRKALNPKRLLAATGVLLLGVLLGAVITAVVFPAPDMSAIDNAQRSARVTATVSEQPARELARLVGTVSPPESAQLLPNSPSGAGDEVVTRMVLEPGAVVNAGDLVAEVSGRPVFAFPAGVPLYRDIWYENTGNDVAAVQQVLVERGLLTTVSGKVDWNTREALRQLYRSAGFTPVDGLPLSHTVRIPSVGLTVAAVAGVGQAIDAEHPMAVLTLQPARITARADMLQAEVLKVGVPVQVQVGSMGTAESEVIAVSEFISGDNGGAAGYDVTVPVPDAWAEAAEVGLPAIVTELGTADTGLAVPLLAIRHRSDGETYVLKVAATNQPDTPVTIRVTAQAGGYAIIAATDELPLGTEIVLTGERT
jgi:hypothetical protein